MSIMESLAVALHYPHINLFYEDIYGITWYCVFFLLPGVLCLRYKKIINFITLKCLSMMIVLASVISSTIYIGWHWFGLFYIAIMYMGILTFEVEVKKEEQARQNNCQVLDGEHKEKKRKVSRTTRVAFIIVSIVSLIKIILSYLSY